MRYRENVPKNETKVIQIQKLIGKLSTTGNPPSCRLKEVVLAKYSDLTVATIYIY